MMKKTAKQAVGVGIGCTLGGAVLLAIGLIGGGALRSVNLQGLLLLVYLIFVSAAAFTIWTSLLRRYDAASVSVYFFLLPVFGVALMTRLHRRLAPPPQA